VMTLTSQQLSDELSRIVAPSLADAVVASYIEMHQRFLAGDWGPSELNGGRLCEAVARCLLQLDTGRVSHSKMPGEIREKILLNDKISHALSSKQRRHISKVIEVVYKFRSDRGAVHISPDYTANHMDSMLVLHAGKWIFAEFLNLAWNRDRRMVAEIIEQLVQMEYSLVHEVEGRPLVLAKGISAPDEVLILLNHAPGNRLTRTELRDFAHNSAKNVNTAVARLIDSRQIRPINDEVVLTPPSPVDALSRLR
jgi:hypothetical protein